MRIALRKMLAIAYSLPARSFLTRVPVMFTRRLLLWFYAVAALGVRLSNSAHAETPLWSPHRPLTAPSPVVEPIQFLTQDASLYCPPCELATVGSTPYCDCSHPQCNSGASLFNEPQLQVHQVPINPVAGAVAQSSVFELLPDDVIWHSYWAGAKEPRTSGLVFNESSDDLSLLDVSLGGRTSLLRNAARNQFGQWRGWEVQIEGAAILRLNLDEDWDFDSADFRFGVPLILAREQVHWKLAYYHLSSHVGDEFLERNMTLDRINYSRDVIVVGASYFPVPAVRLYGETGYAFYDEEGSDPWEFQFGLDYAKPGPTSLRGTPFFAINGHLREEVDFGGNVALQAGWLWRGRTGRVLRTGLHYYNGKSPQFEFFDRFEQQIGLGLWQEY
ncbi:MAG: DUF1207 domain-containing protein [Planctomycetota bacterium]